MTTTAAIRVAGLTKSYGELAVLRGVDLEVPAGSIYALLGSNGAGKTTAVKILSTLLRAHGGTASVNGYDVGTESAAVRESISLTADAWDEGALPDDLAELLDDVFIDSVPGARRVLRRLEQRGWTGWTNVRRADGT